MEAIQKLIPKAIETLEHPTKVNPPSTQAWEKFADFETFNDPQLVGMKIEAATFADEILTDKKPRWLTFLGTSGAGKTMLAKGIAKLYRNRRHGEIDWETSNRTQTPDRPYGSIVRYRGGFINWGNAINNHMLKGDYDFLDDMRNFSFFAIDDIASEYERHRELSAAKLYNVLEGRLKKWTVITANLSLQQIGERLDTRIASRMLRDGGVVVDVDVTDFNLRSEVQMPMHDGLTKPIGVSVS